MPTRSLRRLILLVLAAASIATIAGGGLFAESALAHNTLVSSDPAEGASLPAAPTQITWRFDKTVPLDTMTVTLIDVTGARSELPGSVYGPAGDTEVITPLPPLEPGAVSVRWRLVGPDGHPLTGKVDFTIAAAPTSTVATSAVPAADGPASTVPTPSESAAEIAGDDAGTTSTPSALRWMLRYGSYLAIMAVVGILLTSAFVWADAGSQPLLRRILSYSLLATAGLAFLQVLVVASDVSGKSMWSSFGSIDPALTTDAGMALMIRIVIALAMWIVLFQQRIDHPDVYWTAVSLPGLALLGTWAFAGHSRSMRWPTLGVLTDVAHHAAAAAWIGGLAIIGLIVIPTTATQVLVPAVRNFSRVAAISVAVLVVTGLVQSVRLVGNPANLLDADHGRYLLVKLVILAAMLGLANVNRRRVDARLDDPDTLPRHLGALRNAVLGEFAIGLVIIGITAAMVVSPPSTSTVDSAAPTFASTDVNYTL
jgi:copper transport protein